MGDARREAILNSMHQPQRLALEAYILSLKNGDTQTQLGRQPTLALCDGSASSDSSSECASASSATDAECKAVKKKQGGIYESCDNGKVYGYYAKVTLNNLVFCTRIHRHAADAVRDHI